MASTRMDRREFDSVFWLKDSELALFCFDSTAKNELFINSVIDNSQTGPRIKIAKNRQSPNFHLYAKNLIFFDQSENFEKYIFSNFFLTPV